MVNLILSRQARDFLRSHQLEGFLDDLRELFDLAGVSRVYVGRSGEAIRVNLVWDGRSARSAVKQGRVD